MAKGANAQKRKAVAYLILTLITFNVKTIKGNNRASRISITLRIIVLIHFLSYTGTLFDVEDLLRREFYARVLIAFAIGAFFFTDSK